VKQLQKPNLHSPNLAPLTGANTVPLGISRNFAEVVRSGTRSVYRPRSVAGEECGNNNSNREQSDQSSSPAQSSRSPLDAPSGPAGDDVSPSPSALNILKPYRRQSACFRCLAEDHLIISCTNKIRCRSCYHYWHISRQCLNKRKTIQSVWRKKSEENNIYETSPEVNLVSSTPASYTNSITHISESLISNQSTPTSCLSPTMANYDCDPFPHVPAGMVAIPWSSSNSAWICRPWW
jgi:hypothetical protein